MTYEETAALMVDMVFIGRVKVACLHYASYITSEEPNTPAHFTRYKWAQQAFISPDQCAVNITPVVCGDPQVQVDGSGITDQNLQVAVEAAINKVM